MTRYRLDARCFRGPLCAPVRNDSEQHESDDWEALERIADGLVTRGFTIWLYERVRRAAPLPEAYDLHLVVQTGPVGGADDPSDVRERSGIVPTEDRHRPPRSTRPARPRVPG